MNNFDFVRLLELHLVIFGFRWMIREFVETLRELTKDEKNNQLSCKS